MPSIIKNKSETDQTGWNIPEGRGCYFLLLKLVKKEKIVVGKTGLRSFFEGFYIYVGSSMNGFKSRVKRHIKNKKKFHWHIDYLLAKALIENIVCIESDKRIECKLAGDLSKLFKSIPNFGASDCKCSSHLFFTKNRTIFDRNIRKLLTKHKNHHYITKAAKPQF